MNKLKIFFTILILTFISISVTAQSNDSIKVKQTRSTKDITIKNHNLTGQATYYGSNYTKPRKTASGKLYDKNKLTAAHRTLPFGTIVLVTNKKNGKSVKVEITDRGPFGHGKIIDLSVAAAKEINILKAGVAPVILEILEFPKKK